MLLTLLLTFGVLCPSLALSTLPPNSAVSDLQEADEMDNVGTTLTMFPKETNEKQYFPMQRIYQKEDKDENSGIKIHHEGCSNSYETETPDRIFLKGTLSDGTDSAKKFDINTWDKPKSNPAENILNSIRIDAVREESNKLKPGYKTPISPTHLNKCYHSINPMAKFIGLGRRTDHFYPAMDFMGLGKRAEHFDPTMKFMGLGKRTNNFDPAMKFMGLGKRTNNFDPAMKFMGLGKRTNNFDPALRFMGLGKRVDKFDSGMKYIGLGKRPDYFDPAMKFMGLGKRSNNFDPALRFMGLGKRANNFNPNIKTLGLGKRASYFDPAMKFMGLGKRINNFDPALKLIGLGKRADKFDPVIKLMGLSKRDDHFDPALKVMGLGKRGIHLDPALKVMGLGKRGIHLDPALKVMGLSKRGIHLDPALKYIRQGKRTDHFDPALKFMGLSKRYNNLDPAFKFMGLGKRGIHFDTALKFMGLNKRNDSSGPVLELAPQNKSNIQLETPFAYINPKKLYFYPALKFTGLGKQTFQSYPNTEVTDFKEYNLPSDEPVKFVGKQNYSVKENTVLKSFNKLKHNRLQKEIANPELGFMKKFDLDKRASRYNPVLKLIGLGKRAFKSSLLSSKFNGHGKRKQKFDPALKFIGLGKRGKLNIQSSESGKKGLRQGNDIDSNKLPEEDNPESDPIFETFNFLKDSDNKTLHNTPNQDSPVLKGKEHNFQQIRPFKKSEKDTDKKSELIDKSFPLHDNVEQGQYIITNDMNTKSVEEAKHNIPEFYSSNSPTMENQENKINLHDICKSLILIDPESLNDKYRENINNKPMEHPFDSKIWFDDQGLPEITSKYNDASTDGVILISLGTVKRLNEQHSLFDPGLKLIGLGKRKPLLNDVKVLLWIAENNPCLESLRLHDLTNYLKETSIKLNGKLHSDNPSEPFAASSSGNTLTLRRHPEEYNPHGVMAYTKGVLSEETTPNVQVGPFIFARRKKNVKEMATGME